MSQMPAIRHGRDAFAVVQTHREFGSAVLDRSCGAKRSATRTSTAPAARQRTGLGVTGEQSDSDSAPSLLSVSALP